VKLSRVFEPISINGLEIKNRVARTGHGEHLSHQYVDDRFIAYHEARAKGGCGLSIFGAATVDDSSGTLGVIAHDDVIPRFQKLMTRINPHGMRAFQQLWHGGHLYQTMGGDPPPSVSLVPSPNPAHFAPYPIVGLPMDREEIARIVRAFADSAVRCREGGLHGVELHAAHSYLFYQFLSPVTNTRDDEYGGSLENRMRFIVEVYRAVRKAVGEDFVIGCRLSATQQGAGLHEEDLKTVAQRLQQLGVNYFTGGWGDYFRLETMIGGMQEPLGYENTVRAQDLRGHQSAQDSRGPNSYPGGSGATVARWGIGAGRNGSRPDRRSRSREKNLGR
jgi:2,4-dienoyl-CoA reductase-like NADH-dependent reductase (Old Yellow Enzyme family)